MNGRKVILYLSERQKDGKMLKGHELRDELSGKLVFNANLLDVLYENTHLIPEDWKKDTAGTTLFIYFWDSGFRNPGTDNLYVRYLYFNDGSWNRNYNWLDNDWNGHNPAALLANLFISLPLWWESFVL